MCSTTVRFREVPVLLALFGVFAVAASAAGPNLINYQGFLRDRPSGQPTNGDVDMTFTIFDGQEQGAAVIWGPETHTGVEVREGVFHVVLGSSEPLDADTFDREECWLELGARGELQPRIRFMTTPYAMRATVADEALYVGDLAWIIDGDNMYSSVSGNVGIGTPVPSAKLDVMGRVAVTNADSNSTIELLAGGSGKIELYNQEDLRREAISLDAHLRRIAFRDAGGTISAEIEGEDGVNGNGSSMTLMNNIGAAGVFMDAADDGGSGAISLFNDSAPLRVTLKLAAEGQPGQGSHIILRDVQGRDAVLIDAEQSGGGAALTLGDAGFETVRVDARQGETGGAYMSLLGAASMPPSIFLDARRSDGGSIIELRDLDGELTATIDSEDGRHGGSVITLKDARGTPTVRIDGSEGSRTPLDPWYGGAITLFRADGEQEAVEIDSDIGGGLSYISVDVLRVTGGADLSEQFAIRADCAVKPGMVVSIDPDVPGQLMVSRCSYDRRAVGVVSGAGGLRPGMLMGQPDTPADGEYPVALTGRVYCLVDASYGSIAPGDLLTTSDTPGYAMKVTEHALAQGAILGKAMSGLANGRGLALVLVSLQ